jgi:predicted nuclease of predicted toxin-antitoxin system
MTVRLFADECVAGTIIERLREEGFDIVRAADVCPTADDDEVLAQAHGDQRVLVTADKDFGELVVRLGRPSHGVVNIALGDLPAATRATIVAAGLAGLGRSHCREHRDDRTGPCPGPTPSIVGVLQPRPSPISSMLRRTQSPG